MRAAVGSRSAYSNFMNGNSRGGDERVARIDEPLALASPGSSWRWQRQRAEGSYRVGDGGHGSHRVSDGGHGSHRVRTGLAMPVASSRLSPSDSLVPHLPPHSLPVGPAAQSTASGSSVRRISMSECMPPAYSSCPPSNATWAERGGEREREKERDRVSGLLRASSTTIGFHLARAEGSGTRSRCDPLGIPSLPSADVPVVLGALADERAMAASDLKSTLVRSLFPSHCLPSVGSTGSSNSLRSAGSGSSSITLSLNSTLASLSPTPPSRTSSAVCSFPHTPSTTYGDLAGSPRGSSRNSSGRMWPRTSHLLSEAAAGLTRTGSSTGSSTGSGSGSGHGSNHPSGSANLEDSDDPLSVPFTGGRSLLSSSCPRWSVSERHTAKLQPTPLSLDVSSDLPWDSLPGSPVGSLSTPVTIDRLLNSSPAGIAGGERPHHGMTDSPQAPMRVATPSPSPSSPFLRADSSRPPASPRAFPPVAFHPLPLPHPHPLSHAHAPDHSHGGRRRSYTQPLPCTTSRALAHSHPLIHTHAQTQVYPLPGAAVSFAADWQNCESSGGASSIGHGSSQRYPRQRSAGRQQVQAGGPAAHAAAAASRGVGLMSAGMAGTPAWE